MGLSLSSAIFLDHVPHYPLRQVLSWNLELANGSKMVATESRESGLCLSSAEDTGASTWQDILHQCRESQAFTWITLYWLSPALNRGSSWSVFKHHTGEEHHCDSAASSLTYQRKWHCNTPPHFVTLQTEQQGPRERLSWVRLQCAVLLGKQRSLARISSLHEFCWNNSCPKLYGRGEGTVLLFAIRCGSFLQFMSLLVDGTLTN